MADNRIHHPRKADGAGGTLAKRGRDAGKTLAGGAEDFEQFAQSPIQLDWMANVTGSQPHRPYPHKNPIHLAWMVNLTGS